MAHLCRLHHAESTKYWLGKPVTPSRALRAWWRFGGQAVLLPAVMGATLEQTAALLGVSRASVRLQARFRESVQAGASPPRWEDAVGH